MLDVLLEILEKKQYSHLVLQRALAKYQYLDKQERSFIKRTVDGTLERLMQVDCLIESYSSVKLRKMKPVIPHDSQNERLSDLLYGSDS